MITMGFARRVITPKLPIALAGYDLPRVAHAVHDDLYARCVVFDDNGKRYALVQCDWLGIDDCIRKKIGKRTKKLGIDTDRLLCVATHTHAGPKGVCGVCDGVMGTMQGIFGDVDDAYLEQAADAIADGLEEACQDMEETTIAIGRSVVKGVGAERHDPHRPGDESLLYIELNRTDGKQVMMYNYACHPTVTGPNNTDITADLPYGVERDWDADLVIFINSCCGDISTRFTRDSSSFEQVETYTKRLLEALRDAKDHKQDCGPLRTLDISMFKKEYPCKRVRTVAEEQAHLEACLKRAEEARAQHVPADQLRVIESYFEGAQTAVKMAQALQGIASIPMTVTMMRLQDLVIAGVPGELFSTLGVPLKQAGIEVFGYANGYHLYIADERSYDEGVYESMSSPFEKGVGEALVKEIKERGRTLCQ